VSRNLFGKTRGKSQLRSNGRALAYMQEILKKQESLNPTDTELVERFKKIAEEKYGIKE